MKIQKCILVFFFLACIPVFAKTVRYELVIRQENVNMSGKKTVDFALTVNGQIPAPTLEFTEGDDAEILVKNELAQGETSIHWHGILLPPEQDGVSYVNTAPILAGSNHLFKFKIRQNGTYWYHSHTMLQEQKGVYGAIVIHPQKQNQKVDREAVIVLSDWSDENADQILTNLKKDGDYYLYKKNNIRSYFGALAQSFQSFKNQLYNEWIRMGGMDLSDVGYDAFLINGKKDSQLLSAKAGERIRLRIINAASSTYFYVRMPFAMTVVSADGIEISPIKTKELLMGMAETYDVVFKIPDQKNYEIKAIAQDGTGSSSAYIGAGERALAPIKEKPDLYATMDHSSHTNHGGSSHHEMPMETSKSLLLGVELSVVPQEKKSVVEQSHGMHHDSQVHEAHSHGSSSHKSSSGNSSLKEVESLTWDQIQASVVTKYPNTLPVHDIRLVLDGSMRRYVWYINGKVISQDQLLNIKTNELVRISYVNQTMMHHPMHLHGHFFRVINGQGDYAPLKHTVDVPPHQSRMIEFYANEPGQWMLHCHNLFHMDSGMARVVRYQDYTLTPMMLSHRDHDPHLHDHMYSYGSAEVATNHAQAMYKLMNSWNEYEMRVETAQVDGKNLALGERWQTEVDLHYHRWMGKWLNIFGGASAYHGELYGALGVQYILPWLIDASASITHNGLLRLDFHRRFQWTRNWLTDADVTLRPNWHGERDAEFEITLMYSPQWSWAAGLMFTEKRAGIGAQYQF